MIKSVALALAVAASAVVSVAAQGAPIPENSSWEQVHWARVHGWCMATGFFILLPLGSIAARYLRAYLPFQHWLSAHATIQLLLGLPVIVTGFGVGVHLAMYNGQFKNPHTKIGVTLFLMYWVQLGLGILTAATPSVAMGSADSKGTQPDRRHPMRTRPWYAILHVFWGLSMILIASVQVRRGYKIEWPSKRGQRASESVDRAWIAWVIIIPVIYLGGLALLLKRQWAQERARMLNSSADEKYDTVPTSFPNVATTKPLV